MFDIRRREFITLVGGAAAAWPLVARAQQPGKRPTIGFLGAHPSIESQRVAAFVQRLRELGWIDGRNLAIEYRWAEGRNERYAENAAEFVRLKVDVIVTVATPPTLAAKQATAVIPIGPGRHRPSRESGSTGRQRHRSGEPGI
jgi:putative tryptophan/tyrosine transport system substrate-binding protein